MFQTGREAYLEERILSADPLELVRILYHGCSDAVREARLDATRGGILHKPFGPAELVERVRAIFDARVRLRR